MAKYVGRKIKIRAHYYDDVSDEDVDSDYEYDTIITEYDKDDELWKFVDGFGEVNQVRGRPC